MPTGSTWLTWKEYEAAYGPLSIDRNHRARTYDSYYRAFTKLVREELIPACLASPNPEVVVFGKLLMEHSLSPHVFRHWYTVQLALSGVNEPNELMAFRGDRSPLSALTYLQNKGELEKKYRSVSNELFRYLSWAAQKKFSGKGDRRNEKRASAVCPGRNRQSRKAGDRHDGPDRIPA